MKVRTFVLLLVFLLIALFAVLNWDAFNAATTLSLGFGTVEAPLGVVMLAIVIAISILFLAVLFYVQTSALLETRRHARELNAQRELADRAEASRFNELREYLKAELGGISERAESAQAAIDARIGALESELRAAILESGNSLASYIGEVDDRIERSGGERRPELPAPDDSRRG